MSGKNERKLEDLSVNGQAFREVIEQARKRKAQMIGLRAMIDQVGPELKEIILRPGEIERMKRNLREILKAKGDPGADEQADEFEAMLVEIRRRVEHGVLRFSRKDSAKDTAGKAIASSMTEVADEAVAAEVATSNEGGSSASAAGHSASGEAEAPWSASSSRVPEAQAMARDAIAEPTDDGYDESWRGTPIPPARPRTAGLTHQASEGREIDREEGDEQASQPDPRATDWPNLPGGKGGRSDD